MNILRFLPILKYTILGASMLPTLRTGDKVLINKWAYLLRTPKKGDIVAVKDPRDGKVLIKRITALTHNSYFVQGDNKDHSTDSRTFGMLEKKAIIGKVIG